MKIQYKETIFLFAYSEERNIGMKTQHKETIFLFVYSEYVLKIMEFINIFLIDFFVGVDDYFLQEKLTRLKSPTFE